MLRPADWADIGVTKVWVVHEARMSGAGALTTPPPRADWIGVDVNEPNPESRNSRKKRLLEAKRNATSESCTRCGVEKSTSEFPPRRDKGKKVKRYPRRMCRVCRDQAERDTYHRRKDADRERRRRYERARSEERRVYLAAWRAANPDYTRTWRRNNRERVAAAEAAWRTANAERYRQIRRRWAAANPDPQSSDRAAAWRRAHPERMKLARRRWSKANPEQVRVNRQRRRDRMRTPQGAGLMERGLNRTVVFERDEWTCQLCGAFIDRNLRGPDPMSPSIDHVIPLVRGGDHVYSNMQASHLLCNMRKGSKIAAAS